MLAELWFWFFFEGVFSLMLAELGSWFRNSDWGLWSRLVAVLADLMVCCCMEWAGSGRLAGGCGLDWYLFWQT